MHIIRSIAVGALLAMVAVAQDRIALSNGDVLTGKIKTMADGKVTIESPVLGDVTVSLAEIQNMTTDEQVQLQTVSGDTFKRRIAGIENASLGFDGGGSPIPLDSLDMINPPPVEPPSWAGSLSVNGLWVDGNTRRRNIGISGKSTRKTETDRITVDVNWDYAEDKPTGQPWNLTQRRAGGGLQYDYFIDDRWYALASTRALSDTFADIKLRLSAGVGAGYTVIESETTSLATEAGLSYVDESYRSNTPTKDYLAARVAYGLTYHLSEKTKLTHGVEAYPSLEDEEDIYLQMKAEVVTNLTDSMIASLSWIMDYDNTPAPDFKREDNRVMLSIGWSF